MALVSLENLRFVGSGPLRHLEYRWRRSSIVDRVLDLSEAWSSVVYQCLAV